MTQWMGMESAPRDGTRIVLLVADGDHTIQVPAEWFELQAEWRTPAGQLVSAEFLGWWPMSADED